MRRCTMKKKLSKRRKEEIKETIIGAMILLGIFVIYSRLYTLIEFGY